MGNNREVLLRKARGSKEITNFYFLFFTDRPWRSSRPHLSTAVSRPAAKIQVQAFRRLHPLPHTRSHRWMPTNRPSPSQFDPPQTKSYRSSEDQKMNVVMLPPHRPLYRWPSFQSSPLSNSTSNFEAFFAVNWGPTVSSLYQNLCFCVRKIIKNIINYLSTTLNCRWVAQNHPQTTKYAAFGYLRQGRQGDASFTSK